MVKEALAILLAGLAVATGCTADFLKNVESGAYDKAAAAVSNYCERTDSDVINETRIEARREIRQRGTEGPAPIFYEGLDDQTAGGKGPVVRIWCHGENVPVEVWKDLIK